MAFCMSGCCGGGGGVIGNLCDCEVTEPLFLYDYPGFAPGTAIALTYGVPSFSTSTQCTSSFLSAAQAGGDAWYAEFDYFGNPCRFYVRDTGGKQCCDPNGPEQDVTLTCISCDPFLAEIEIAGASTTAYIAP